MFLYVFYTAFQSAFAEVQKKRIFQSASPPSNELKKVKTEATFTTNYQGQKNVIISLLRRLLDAETINFRAPPAAITQKINDSNRNVVIKKYL